MSSPMVQLTTILEIIRMLQLKICDGLRTFCQDYEPEEILVYLLTYETKNKQQFRKMNKINI